MPSLTIRFSEIQENIFSIYSFPTDILKLDTKNSFYYGFRPEIREFPVKLKLNDIFKPEEVVFESFDEGNNKLNMTINSDNSDYKVLLKEKTNREYKVVDIKENIILTGRPTEHNIYDELLIKNIIVKFIGIK